MDLTSVWGDLWKLGPVFAIMGAVIYVLYSRNKSLEDKNDKLQDDKLILTKQAADIANIANKHIEASNEWQKEIPQVFATAIVTSQDKIISEVRQMIREIK